MAAIKIELPHSLEDPIEALLLTSAYMHAAGNRWDQGSKQASMNLRKWLAGKQDFKTEAMHAELQVYCKLVNEITDAAIEARQILLELAPLVSPVLLAEPLQVGARMLAAAQDGAEWLRTIQDRLKEAMEAHSKESEAE